MPVSGLEVCEPVMLAEGGIVTVITESLSTVKILTAAGATARPRGGVQGGGAADGAALAEKKKARLSKGVWFPILLNDRHEMAVGKLWDSYLSLKI